MRTWVGRSNVFGKRIAVGTDYVTGTEVSIKIGEEDGLIAPDTARKMAAALLSAADEAECKWLKFGR